MGFARATEIFERLRANRTIEIIGLRAIEIFQTTRIGEQHELAHVSIAIPVTSRTGLVKGAGEKSNRS